MKSALAFDVNPAVPVDAAAPAWGGRRVWWDVADPTEADHDAVARALAVPLDVVRRLLRRPGRVTLVEGSYVLSVPRVTGPALGLLVRGPLLVSLHRGAVASLDHLRDVLLDPARGAHIAGEGPFYLAALLLERLAWAPRERLEAIGTRIDELEDRALRGSREELAHATVQLRRSFHAAEHALHGLLRVADELRASEAEALTPKTLAVLERIHAEVEDLLHHAQLSHERISSVLAVHASVVSVELNDAMRLLTVVATALLVPTLIAGIYGMNFPFIPEFRWRWGYPFAVALMLASTLAVLAWFRRRGFLGPRGRREGAGSTTARGKP